MPFFPDLRPADLFSNRPLDVLFDELRGRVKEAVASYQADDLLSSPTEDVVEFVSSFTTLEVPMLLEDLQFQDLPREVTKEVKDYGRHIRVDGFEYKLTIPFSGHLGLFRHSSPTQLSTVPAGVATDKEVSFTLSGYNLTADEVKAEFKRRVDAVKFYLAGQARAVDQFNKEIVASIQSQTETRKANILASRRLAASLGYPMKRVGHAPMTHVASNVRRKVTPVRTPQATVAPFVPEPALEEAEYQYILKIIQDMAIMMERSPSAFERLEEEHLRDFFLMVLNGHYEGRATGETFNTGGKTDILIREQNQNIFIAECKYWRGPKSATEAIDQLLGYLNWRDTKACLMVFNRNRNVSAMIETLQEAAAEHPHYKRGPLQEAPGRLRYVFGSPNDSSRETIITAMIFDVPNKVEG